MQATERLATEVPTNKWAFLFLGLPLLQTIYRQWYMFLHPVAMPHKAENPH